MDLKSKLRYNKRFGSHAYNYRYDGYFAIEKYRIDLIEGEEDVQYLDEEHKTTELKSIKFHHDQNFDQSSLHQCL